ncbi:hypothetical protein [Cohnella nanjingensis]|uniref:Uncharacterized protein n=1 Tax=Cohnella nanjingensis TaxID=1387779 RepID=A0A7X0RTP7_9BACL|nr:hypothetical protein [Cohnella nanjingensis]MBB6673341.1 hypothetical protein [Cohnella nanjingensis]
MEKGIVVHLLEKQPNGVIAKIDERLWTADMLAALHHVNYLTVGGNEYETLEGRLNVDAQSIELLLAAVRHGKSI